MSDTWLIINTSGYGEPDVTGPFETQDDALDNLFAWWIECGIVDTLEEAVDRYETDDRTWVVQLSDPYKVQDAA